MIPQMLLKLVLPKILDHVMKVFKLKKVLQYVEEDNELDVQMRDTIQKCTDIGFKVTAMQTVLKELDEKTQEFEDMKAVIKKLKNKKVFKSLGK